MRAVFLDRDGVINEDRDDYIKSIHELKVFPFAPAAIRRLNKAGLCIFVVSNQQGIAKGVISEDDLRGIQNEINRQVEEAGGKITEFYYCKHLSLEECACRKPQAGMLMNAAREHGVELKESVMVGDSERDIIAGKRAGCKTVLVLTGKLAREDTEYLTDKPDFVANDLSDAAEYIISLR